MRGQESQKTPRMANTLDARVAEDAGGILDTYAGSGPYSCYLAQRTASIQ